MNPRAKAGTILAGACLVAVLVVTPSAQAAVTASNVTTPKDVSYFVYNYDSPNTFAVSGTTTGGTTGDHVDVRCYAGDQTGDVASNVAVSSDGSFSAPAGSLDNANLYRPCVVRAVPAGTTPANLTPFAGPRIMVGFTRLRTLTSGPNSGTAYDWYMFAQQLAGGFDYASLAGCGVDDGYLNDSSFNLTTVTFWCNAALFKLTNESELKVDGANAFPTDSAKEINANATGLATVTYSESVDPKTGNLVIQDTEPLVKCTDTTWPPDTTKCATFVSTGVTDHRTITQDHDGRVAWVTDVFKSTDGHSHALDLLWDNNQRFYHTGGDSTQVEYEFPGQGAYSTHVLNDTVTLPPHSGTILVRVHGAADGDTATGRGAIVYDRPANQASFRSVQTNDSTFTLHQTANVPGSGSTTFRFAYIQDFEQANVETLAKLATDTFRGCTVPKVVGKSLAAAKKAITHADCTVGKVTKAFSKKVNKGRVISSKPKAGKHLAYRAKVALTVSKGKKK
jgi:PASTA domain-containing protein